MRNAPILHKDQPTEAVPPVPPRVHESAAVNGSGQTSQFFVQPKTSNGSQS